MKRGFLFLIMVAMLILSSNAALSQTYSHGIDVSKWQGNIAWSQVYNSGIEFAFVKATEGVGYTDPYLHSNIAGAQGANIRTGVYHFATPYTNGINDAVAEADSFVSSAGSYMTSGHIRPVLDLESQASLGKTMLSQWVNDWMGRVEQLTGVEPLIYVNTSYANNYLDSSIANYDLWIANWKNTYVGNEPGTGVWDDWDFWQWTDSGSVGGISGAVDLDVFKGDWENVTVPDPTVPPAVHYTFKETAPGSWDVMVDVTGDTTGLSAYEIWVDNVEPGTTSFEENTLGTVVGEDFTPVGFAQGTFLQGDIDDNFNAGNFQGSGDGAIEGIGMVGIYEPGSMPGTTPLVYLDAQARLGTLSTEVGLTEENFRVTSVGLLNAMGDGFFDTDETIPTFDVIQFAILFGDANNDGVVSAADYSSVQANFGVTGDPGMIGDANGDGVVSAADYSSVQANFGNIASATAPVPEPASISLFLTGSIALLARRRKNYNS